MTASPATPYTGKYDDVYSAVDSSCDCVSVPDRGGFVAKRQGCGSGRRVWRNGLADGLWTARVGNPAFEGDHDFGDSVYDYVPFVVDSGNAECRARHIGIGKFAQVDYGAEDGSRAGTGSCPGSSAGSGGSIDDSAVGDAAAAGRSGSGASEVKV